MQGQLIVESIDQLSIRNNVISVRGVLGGKNMTVNAMVADKPFRVQLGELRLPVSCDLLTRFDRQTRNLYITPALPNEVTARMPDWPAFWEVWPAGNIPLSWMP